MIEKKRRGVVCEKEGKLFSLYFHRNPFLSMFIMKFSKFKKNGRTADTTPGLEKRGTIQFAGEF
jgi:hypothetical protein